MGAVRHCTANGPLKARSKRTERKDVYARIKYKNGTYLFVLNENRNEYISKSYYRLRDFLPSCL